MKVLVVGGGGREHVLAWAVARDTRVEKIYCAPGNAGTAILGENVAVGAEDIDGLVGFAVRKNIDFTVVGPEAPLCNGIVDRFVGEGLRVFGPSKAAAEIEGSKVFSKQFMRKYGIPTAQGEIFEEVDAALTFIEGLAYPIVIKADGLAAGKGVLIIDTLDEAKAAIRSIMVEGKFGKSGKRVIVEEYLEGEEASILAITDGERYYCLAASQDYKRIYDGDQGPNTGGMGAYAPAPVVTDAMQERIEREILVPTLRGLHEDGRRYRGVLYLGLMVTGEEPKVLEYNCRFGDPESQAVLPLFDGDFLGMLEGAANGQLPDRLPGSSVAGAAVCVVLASGGYPGSYQKGKVIRGLDSVAGEDLLLFHAGTKVQDGKVVTSGGRVLNVVGLGDSLPAAVERAYQGAAAISFDGMYYRKDIAYRALRY